MESTAKIRTHISCGKCKACLGPKCQLCINCLSKQLNQKCLSQVCYSENNRDERFEKCFEDTMKYISDKAKQEQLMKEISEFQKGHASDQHSLLIQEINELSK